MLCRFRPSSPAAFARSAGLFVVLTGLFVLSTLQEGSAAPRPRVVGSAVNWLRTLDPPSPVYNSNARALSVAFDGAGNLIAGGAAPDPQQPDSLVFTLAKWDTAGQLLWSRTLGVPGSFDTSGADRWVTVDAADEIIVFGALGGTLNHWTTLVAKVDPNGGLVWSRSEPWLAHAALFPNGDVFVAGSDASVGGALVVSRLAGVDGHDVWSHPNDPATEMNVLGGVCVTHSGDPVLTGHSEGDAYGLAITGLRGSDGAALWSQRVGQNGLGMRVTVDGEDRIIAAGYTRGPNGGDFLTVARLVGDTGSLQWEFHRSGPAASGDDLSNGIAVDAQDQVYVSGEIGALGSQQFTIFAFGNAGDLRWRQAVLNEDASGQPDLSLQGPTLGSGVAVDSAGNVYAAGTSLDGMPGLSVLALDPQGLPLWQQSIGGGGVGGDGATCLAVTASGQVAAGGYLAKLPFAPVFAAGRVEGPYAQPQLVSRSPNSLPYTGGMESIVAQPGVTGSAASMRAFADATVPVSIPVGSLSHGERTASRAGHTIPLTSEISAPLAPAGAHFQGQLSVPAIADGFPWTYDLFAQSVDGDGLVRTAHFGQFVVEPRPSGTLRLSRSRISFGMVRVGGRKQQRLSLRNTGSASLFFQPLTTNAAFTYDFAGIALPPPPPDGAPRWFELPRD